MLRKASLPNIFVGPTWKVAKRFLSCWFPYSILRHLPQNFSHSHGWTGKKWDGKGRSHRCVVISVPEHLDKFICWFLDTRRPKRISDDITTSRLLKRRRNDVTNFFSMALRHMQVSPQTGMSGYIHIPQFISYTKPLGKYCNLRFFSFIFCDSAALEVVVVGIVYSCAEYVRL